MEKQKKKIVGAERRRVFLVLMNGEQKQTNTNVPIGARIEKKAGFKKRRRKGTFCC